MQSPSLPKKVRGNQSPVIAIDSPFPPLRTDQRYRGVYERAGFDVNLGHNSSDDRSLYSKKSPTSTAASGRPNFFANGQKMQRNFSPVSGSHSSPSSARSSNEKLPPLNTNDTNANYPSNFRAQDRYTPNSSVPVSSGSSQYMTSSQKSLSGSSRSSGRSQIKQFMPEQRNPRLNNINAQNEQRIVEHSDRNKKHLKLFIPNNEPSFPSASESADTNERNSPFDNVRGSGNSTPSTSASSSENFSAHKMGASSPVSVKTSELVQRTPYPVYEKTRHSERDLDSSLADFKSELNEHKAYDPRGASTHHGVKNSANNATAFVPVKGDLAESFSKEELEDSMGTIHDNKSNASNASFRFHNRHSAESAEPSRNDYEQFLHTSNNNKQARNSQFSTISSIISKQHKPNVGYNDRDSDEYDDEVALELQRQLEQIKTGSQYSLVSNSVVHSEDSFVTAPNSFGNETCNIPTFRISDEGTVPSFGVFNAAQSEESESESDTDTDNETENEMDSNDTNDTTAVDGNETEVEPLFAKQDEGNEPFTPHFRQAEFNNDSIYDTPETIKPLSPKNHFVEKELENLNFKYQESENASGLQQPLSSEQDIDILGKNPTPSEFDAFPKSVIDPNFPTFRNSEVSRKAPPGTGPCRSCGLSIKGETKGPQKPIYSKVGDLSGQWHRGCFKCSYANCPTRFNKDISPYVLLDNAFCNHHYHTLNNTLCETCHSGIEGECIENELKQKWHISCLKCTRCQGVIKNDYFLINHSIVCEADASSVIRELTSVGLTTSDKVEKRRTRMLFIE